MRTAQTILTIIQDRGKRKLPLERVYKMLFHRELYLAAYAKLYSNSGAMTKGTTEETVDGMSVQKIDRIIEALRTETYQWTPVKRDKGQFMSPADRHGQSCGCCAVPAARRR